jgi:hypothetical protein
MTKEERRILRTLISEVSNTRMELGSIVDSYFWNSAYKRVQEAEKELEEYLDQLEEK